MARRIGIIFSIFLLFNFAVFYKMNFIINDEKATADAGYSSYSVELSQNRGTVFDRNGELLTNNKTTTKAVFTPEALDDKKSEIYLTAAQKKTLENGYPVATIVPPDFSMTGAVVTTVKSDVYSILPHILGYTNSDGEGVCGVQKSFNETLSGEKIAASVRRDATGKMLSQGITFRGSENKNSVTLTIDKRWQTAAYTAAEELIKKGAVVVLDTKTAEILACVSLPDFDVNSPEKSLGSKDAPFINRAFSAYPVGSIFKIVTSAEALKRGIDPQYNCTGQISLSTAQFTCMNDRAHGVCNIKSALGFSCNTYFVNLSTSLQSLQMYSTAKLLGFGSAIRLCDNMTSSSGVLPTVDTLKIAGEKANFAFGQGTLTAAPLTVASLIQTVANGGKRVIPTLIKSVKTSGKTQNYEKSAPIFSLDEKTAKTLCDYMVEAVKSGTATGGAISGLTIGAKTATAETGNSLDTWYAGFCTDYGVSIAVMCEDGKTGSADCAPVFKRLIELYAQTA